MANDDEDDLLQRAQQGDQRMLAALLERHGPAVRARMRGTIPARWQAIVDLDDVLQQTYTDAFLNIGSFTSRGEGALTAWLHAIARNNLFDVIKMLEADKRGGDRIAVARPGPDASYDDMFDLLAASITSPSGGAARDEARSALRSAVEGLPQLYRSVVELYDLQGIAIDDVAARLGRSKGAAWMLRARAHRLLADRLGGASRFLSARYDEPVAGDDREGGRRGHER